MQSKPQPAEWCAVHGMGNSKVVGVKVPLDRQLRPQGKCTNSPNTTRETPLCSRLRTAESSPWQSPDSRFKYAVAPDASALASPAAWASAETVPCVATTLSMLAHTALMTHDPAPFMLFMQHHSGICSCTCASWNASLMVRPSWLTRTHPALGCGAVMPANGLATIMGQLSSWAAHAEGTTTLQLPLAE